VFISFAFSLVGCVPQAANISVAATMITNFLILMIFAAKKRKNCNKGLTYIAVYFAQITTLFL